jgi:polysaccharide lyase-like protein
MIALRKTSETATKMTIAWDPVPGAGAGYRGREIGAAKWTQTQQTQMVFRKGAEVEIEALGIVDRGTYPVIEPPPPPPSSDATLIAKASYEGFSSVNAVPLWTNHVQQKEPGRMTIVDDPLGQRGKVMRVEVRPGDTDVAGSGTWERAQVYASNAMVPLVDGAIIARSMYIMIPTTTQFGRYAPYCGDHHSGTTGGGNFRIDFSANGTMSLSYFWGDAANKQRFDKVIASPLSKGVWHHIVAAHKYSPDATKGWVKFSLDGTVKVDQALGNLYIGQSAYHKEGWYREAFSQTHVHYSDTTSFWKADTVEEAYAAALAN